MLVPTYGPPEIKSFDSMEAVQAFLTEVAEQGLALRPPTRCYFFIGEKRDVFAPTVRMFKLGDKLIPISGQGMDTVTDWIIPPPTR